VRPASRSRRRLRKRMSWPESLTNCITPDRWQLSD
jgi:hypothetical protein